MAPFSVLLTDGAAHDLAGICDYVAGQDSPRKASALLDRFEQMLADLAEHPHRGVCPKELAALGIRRFRQVTFKPYRIIYRVAETQIFVLLIADGRRDMRSLLERRLLAAD